jgi:hypothetical protein
MRKQWMVTLAPVEERQSACRGDGTSVVIGKLDRQQ